MSDEDLFVSLHPSKFISPIMSVTILGIESSCDDTSAAVIRDGLLLSNIIASQSVHEEYGGVVPELASRAHQQNIVPVVDAAIRHAGISRHDIQAIAFTRGPGLLGSLLVGTSFAKGLSLGLQIPIVDVNHLHGHVLSHFIREKEDDIVPTFPFLCLLISGGNSQIILVRSHNDMEILGKTIDDAAGEAFDKCAKVMGLPYPGGPHIDRLAAEGDAKRFKFAKPHIAGLDYSFSGLKTSFLYTIRDAVKTDPDFIKNNMADLAASLQQTIIDILLDKLRKAVDQTGVMQVAIGGGVSANSGVRNAIADFCSRCGLTAFIPQRKFTTDNAAMVAIAGYFKYLDNKFCDYNEVPYARVTI
jgi:N6-L-threonylcarbamoyladenine synthase